MILRPYQEDAILALRTALASINRPVVCLPTGSGKTPTICTLIHRLAQRYPNEQFVVAVNTQELVSQLAGTYERISGHKPAIYSASLKRKELGRIVFGQIQSIYKKASAIGRIKLLAIDECDRIPVDGDGQYRKFIEESTLINPDLRVCGFTATPYRMQSGLVYGEGQPFDQLVYDADIRTLIDAGFLSKLVSKNGGGPSIEGVRIRNGDFANDQLEAVMSDEQTVAHAVDEIIKYGHDRKAWLVFCSGIKHATLVSKALEERGIHAPIVEGNTPDAQRKQMVLDYRERRLSCLVNVNVLSIGFDAPHVDLLALLRPTLSPGLYYQQIGRGLRISEGKDDCLVLDLAGNINRHGPIDTLNQRIQAKKSAKEKGDAPTKTCAQCSEIVHAAIQTCPSCGFLFPPPKIAKHGVEVLASEPLATTSETEITDVSYRLHKGKPGKPDTICVHYKQGMLEVAKQFLSPSVDAHPYAYAMFLRFIRETPINEVDGTSITLSGGKVNANTPDGVVEITSAATMLPYCQCFAKPIAIKHRPGKDPRYPDIVSRRFI